MRNEARAAYLWHGELEIQLVDPLGRGVVEVELQVDHLVAGVGGGGDLHDFGLNQSGAADTAAGGRLRPSLLEQQIVRRVRGRYRAAVDGRGAARIQMDGPGCAGRRRQARGRGVNV